MADAETVFRSVGRELGPWLARIPDGETGTRHRWIWWQREMLLAHPAMEFDPATYKTDIFAELARLGDAVPADVECGYHLCYGSPRDAYLVMPKDTGILVGLANGLIERLSRRLDFLHLPVTQDRTDAAFYAPLHDLRLPANTTFYLGLIHHDDSSGDQARIAAAAAVVPSFGVATECGWGRGDPERIPDLLAAHRHVMER